MTRWAFRLYRDGVTEDAPQGQPYYDDIRKNFGVNDSGIIRWFLRSLTNGLRLNPGKNLTGMTNDTTENTLVLDFNTSGEIRVVDTANNNNILARFTASGALFASAAVTGTYGFGGLINQVLNGSLLVLRDFLPALLTVSPTTQQNCMIAPNWFLWCSKQSTGGSLSVSLDSQDVPPNCQNSAVVQVLTPSYQGGLRSFLYSAAQLAGKPLCLVYWLKGPANASFKTRLLTNTGSLKIVNQTATGSWQKIVVPLDLSQTALPVGSTVLAIDTLYALSTLGTWKVGGLQLNFGLGPLDPEARSLETERSLLSGIYYSGQKTVTTTKDVSFGLISGPTTVETSLAAITATNTKNTGTTLTGSSGDSVLLCAYSAPVITESL